MTSTCALSNSNTTFSLSQLPQSLSNASSPRTYCAANGREPNMVSCCAPNPVNAYTQFGPCAAWCDIPRGKFTLPHGQDVLSTSDGQELDQLFTACLMNGTRREMTGTTLCEMPSAGTRMKLDGVGKLRWMVMGLVTVYCVDGFRCWI